jgi:hypothetical protein
MGAADFVLERNFPSLAEMAHREPVIKTVLPEKFRCF